jgi:hypothetical protein
MTRRNHTRKFRPNHTPDLDRRLAPGEITVPTLSRLLDAAAIDHDVHHDGEAVLVTAFAINVMLHPHPEAGTLAIRSICEFAEGSDPEAALGFVNACNVESAMVQFALVGEPLRLGGYHVLWTTDGLLPRQIIRAASRFAGGFRGAVAEAVSARLMTLPWIDEPVRPCAGLVH